MGDLKRKGEFSDSSNEAKKPRKELPRDIWNLIATFLPFTCFLKMRLVCKTFSTLRIEEVKLEKIKKYIVKDDWNKEIPIKYNDLEMYNLLNQVKENLIHYDLFLAIKWGSKIFFDLFWPRVKHPDKKLLTLLGYSFSQLKWNNQELYHLLIGSGYILDSKIIFHLQVPLEITENEVRKLSSEERGEFAKLCLKAEKHLEVTEELLAEKVPINYSQSDEIFLSLKSKRLLHKYGYINFQETDFIWVEEDGRGEESEEESDESVLERVNFQILQKHLNKIVSQEEIEQTISQAIKTERETEGTEDTMKDPCFFFFELYPTLKSDERYQKYISFVKEHNLGDSWLVVYKYFYPEINGNKELLYKLIRYDQILQMTEFQSYLDVVLFFSDLMIDQPGDLFLKHKILLRPEHLDFSSLYTGLYLADCYFLFQLFLEKGGLEMFKKQLLSLENNDNFLWEILIKWKVKLPISFEEIDNFLKKIDEDDCNHNQEKFYLILCFLHFPDLLDLLIKYDFEFIYLYTAILSGAKINNSLIEKAKSLQEEKELLTCLGILDYDGSVLSYLRIRSSVDEKTSPLLFSLFR